MTSGVRFVRMLLVLLIGATMLGCAGTHRVAVAKLSRWQEATSDGISTNRSVYRLTSDWTTDTGKTIKLGELRGKPQVAGMFFTSCRGACPILVHEMQQLAESLPEKFRTKVGFLLVSFDPEHDTPEVLRAYRVARNLPENQWTLLHGSPGDVRELAQLLGVTYRRRGESSQFAHSSLITILDSNGEISYQQIGLSYYTDELKTRLVKLLEP